MQAWDRVSPTEFSSLYRRVRAHTMCSNARLRGLYRAVQYVVSHEIEGDIVECGSARGGSAALMALTVQKLHASRKIWLFDTFDGLPAPTVDDPDFELADLSPAHVWERSRRWANCSAGSTSPTMWSS